MLASFTFPYVYPPAFNNYALQCCACWIELRKAWWLKSLAKAQAKLRSTQVRLEAVREERLHLKHAGESAFVAFCTFQLQGQRDDAVRAFHKGSCHGIKVRFLIVCTVTFRADPAHNLTRPSP